MAATVYYNRSLTQLVQKVIQRLSQVPGTGTQTYAEDRIADMVQHKFTVLFEEAFWGHLCHWYTVTLDGALGVPNESMFALSNPLRHFDDIQGIYPTGADKPLPHAPSSRNVFQYDGETPRFVAPYNQDDKVFRIYPATATGTLEMYYRSRPPEYNPSDIVNFDNQALILGATYDYLEDDGTNPNATQKFKDMFEARVRQLKENKANLPRALDTRSHATLDDWSQVP